MRPSMCPVRIPLWRWIPALAFFWVPSALLAQEYGLHGLLTSSSIPEMASPRGLGFYAWFPASPHSAIRASVYRQGQSFGREAPVCIQYQPSPVGCRVEPIDTEARLAGATVTGLLRRALLTGVEGEVGLGVSLSEVAVRETTDSGRASNLYTQNTAQAGALLHLGARIRPSPSVPLSLELSYGHHLKELRACSEDAWRFTPFCGTSTFREFRVGLGYRR
jgi:hypothetical protein